MQHGETAEQLFRDGYNCAQAVLMAFADVTGLEPDTAARLASSFGGGLGRMREVCGAVSGASMVLGLVKGYADPTDADAKKAHYHLVSIICRDLLSGTAVRQGNDPEARTAAYYQKRPCPALVRQAAEILDEMLDHNG